jgi:ABC-2 type transport system permease protein
MRSFWPWFTLAMVFGAPALTMGLLADEKQSGTLELLLTMPVRDHELILGKYLAVVGFYTILLGLTLTYPLSVSMLGELDWGQVMAGYLGMFLTGCAMLAFGLLASSWTSSQVVALFIALTYCGWVGFLFDKFLVFFLSDWATALEWMSFDYHRGRMARGVVDSRDVFFFVSAIALPLIFAFRSIESRRWR